MPRASYKMSDLLRKDKAKNSEFEAIPSAGLLKNYSFGVVSMKNVKCTEKAGSDFNSSNVYSGGGQGGGEVPVNVCVATTTTMRVLKF